MAMTKSELRQHMIHYKTNLEILYECESLLENQTLISNSSDQFVLVLLNILYRVGAGYIPMKKDLYSKLAKGKKVGGLLKYFGSEQKLLKTLAKSREEQMKILRKFTSAMPVLLHYILHKAT